MTAPLTEQRARAIVQAALAEFMRAYADFKAPFDAVAVSAAIAERAAKELAGHVVEPLTEDRVRGVVRLAVAERLVITSLAALGPDAFAGVVHDIADRAARELAGHPLATAFDRASVAITGQSAAELAAQLKPATANIAPADTAVIVDALDWFSTTVPIAPHADIARIRAALTGTTPKEDN